MKFAVVAVQGRQPPKPRELYTVQEQKAPLLDLLVKAEPTRIPAQRSELEAQSGAYLRDLLLAINPLDKDWVVKVNQVRLITLSLGSVSLTPIAGPSGF